MEEAPETIQVTIRNKLTNRSKDLIVYVSDEVNLYQHIYDNPSVHGAFVRTWSTNIVSAVKDGTSTIVCSVENTPIVLSLLQMKNTTTKKLYHHISKTGSLSNINLTLDVVQSDSLVDEMTVHSDTIADDGLESTHRYPLVEEIPSEFVLSNAIETMNIKIQNQFTMRSIVLDIRISEDVNIFDEIYNNSALLKAQIRNWSSDIVAGIKNESKAIVASVSGTQVRISITKMKKTSTKQLHDYVSEVAPRQHPQLVLGIVKSDELPGIDARFELQDATRSEKDKKETPTKADELDDVIEIGSSSDLDNSIDLEKEEIFKPSENNEKFSKGKDEEKEQGSTTDIETDSDVNEDDDTVVAGNESPKTSPRSQHQAPQNHQIPSIIVSPIDDVENTKKEDTAFIGELDFDRPHDIERKTAYGDFFLGDQAGFEVSIDNGVEDDFTVLIAEKRLDVTEDYPSPQLRQEQEKEPENNESFNKSNTSPAEIKKFLAAGKREDFNENQIEIEASFIPKSHLKIDSVDVDSFARTVAVVVHCRADTAQSASAEIQSTACGNSIETSQSYLQASVIQAAFRQSKARAVYKHDIHSIVIVQSLGRRWLVKQMLVKRELAALTMQSEIRSRASQKIASSEHEKVMMQGNMAGKLQSVYRGLKVRSDVDSKLRAAGQIQSTGQKWLKEKVAKLRADKATRSDDKEQERIRAEEEARPTAQGQGKVDEDSGEDEEASLEATLTRLKAKQDARLRAEEEARLQAEGKARLVFDAQVRAEKALVTLEAVEQARVKGEEEEAGLKFVDARAATVDDSEGYEVEYIPTSHEGQHDEVQEAFYAEVSKDIKSVEMPEKLESISNSEAVLEETLSVNGETNGNDEHGEFIVRTESLEAQTEAETHHLDNVAEHQGDDAVDFMTSKVESEVSINEEGEVADISEKDLDSKISRADVSTGSESRKQETDSFVVTQTAVQTMHSCETFGVENTKPSVDITETQSTPPAEPEVAVTDVTRGMAEGGTNDRNSIITKFIQGASNKMVNLAGANANNNVTSEEDDREKKSEPKVGVSISSKDSDADTNSASLDTIDMLIMGLKKKREIAIGSSHTTSSNTDKLENCKTEKKRDHKFAISPSTEESYTDTNSTSLDTLDKMVLRVDNNSKAASSSRSSEKRDESVVLDSQAKRSISQDSPLTREQVSSTPEGSQDSIRESSGSEKFLSAVPVPSIVTTRKDDLQTSHPASVCSSLNTSPSYYEKFDSKLGSKMILKALHTPISEAKTSPDGLILSDDDHSSKPEAPPHISKAASKDDIITLTARYEEFAKQLKSLVVQANTFQQAISEKEKARTKFFEECGSMTNNTPLHVDIGNDTIPESADIPYARAQVEDMTSPRSMCSVVALSRIYLSSSVKEYQQQILAYVTAWTEAVTTKVEGELQTYDKLEETLYHYEVKVDELRAKSKGNISTKLTRNYKKLAVAGQKRDEQLERVCYLLKAVVDNSWKDLYPLIEQTMVWETNRRDAQVDTMGMMLPKTMVNMKENIKTGKTIPAPEQESLEAELCAQTRENRKLQYRINKLEAILRSDEWSHKNEMIPKLSCFKFGPTGRKTTE